MKRAFRHWLAYRKEPLCKTYRIAGGVNCSGQIISLRRFDKVGKATQRSKFHLTVKNKKFRSNRLEFQPKPRSKEKPHCCFMTREKISSKCSHEKQLHRHFRKFCSSHASLCCYVTMARHIGQPRSRVYDSLLLLSRLLAERDLGFSFAKFKMADQCEATEGELMYRSNRSFNIPPPPRANPRAFDFFENYCLNSLLPGRKCRSDAPH